MGQRFPIRFGKRPFCGRGDKHAVLLDNEVLLRGVFLYKPLDFQLSEMGKLRAGRCSRLGPGHFTFGARAGMALTRERGGPRYYCGVWEASPAPAEGLQEPGFLFPLSSSKITTQQESICTLELGGVRKTADLVNLCPDLL